MSSAVIKVEHLGKKYRLGAMAPYNALRDVLAGLPRRLASAMRSSGPKASASIPELWALKDVSLSIEQGEIVGVIGGNGAGKSTLLKILSRITKPTEGRAIISGRVGCLLEVGTGFHPELTGRENIYLNGAILGMRRQEIQAKFNDMVDFSGVSQFLDTPVKRYSSGMRMRLAFAVAAFLDADILFVDEVLAVGDAEFQRRCMGRMSEVSRSGRTVIFVSHNMAAVTSLCQRGVLLQRGRVSMDGPIDQVAQKYVESLAADAGVPLSERSDRTGDGSVFVTRISLHDDTGVPTTAVRCGAPCVFHVDYRVRPGFNAPHGVNVNLMVIDNLGRRISSLSSYFSGRSMPANSGGGTWVCRLPDMCLSPDHYSLAAHVASSQTTHDHIENALQFDVIEADFYGSGHYPQRNQKHGVLLMRSAWE